jgi:hypothetical protein
MANDYVQIALDCVDDLDVVVAIKVKLQEYMLSETAKFGITYLSDERVLELLDMDLQINAQGLAVWLKSSGKLKQN